MKRNTKGGLLIAAIIILTSIFWDLLTRIQLNEKGVFVIGTLKKIEGAKASLRGFIKFQYKNVEYNSDFLSKTISHKDTCRRFFVKIIPSCPTCYFIVDENTPVPDSLKESPINGWDSLPVKFNK